MQKTITFKCRGKNQFRVENIDHDIKCLIENSMFCVLCHGTTAYCAAGLSLDNKEHLVTIKIEETEK